MSDSGKPPEIDLSKQAGTDFKTEDLRAIANLLDENERLTAERDIWKSRVDRDQNFYDEARAEIADMEKAIKIGGDALGKVNQELVQLLAIGERVLKERDAAQTEADSLRLLAESYRAKLAQIAEWRDVAMDDKTAWEMREEARAALKETK